MAVELRESYESREPISARPKRPRSSSRPMTNLPRGSRRSHGDFWNAITVSGGCSNIDSRAIKPYATRRYNDWPRYRFFALLLGELLQNDVPATQFDEFRESSGLRRSSTQAAARQ